MRGTADRIAGLKDPAYTGENRCLPCTAVNAAIAVVAALGAGYASTALGADVLALPLAAGLLVASATAIYLRGYLVPGTPSLTKQYAPEWFLALFGKAPARHDDANGDAPPKTGPLDVEETLLEAGALTERRTGEDLELADAVADELHAAFDAVDDEGSDRERLCEVLDANPGDLEFADYGSAFTAERDGTAVGKWESRAAFLADVAAAGVLAGRVDRWNRLSIRERGELLRGLRLFLTTCPDCAGDLTFGSETVESCCSTHQVVAVECEDCGARLFEHRGSI